MKRTSKKLKTTALQRTAYHEAGHAVMSYYLNRPFRYVSVIPDETNNSLGHILYRQLSDFDPDLVDEKTERQLQKLIMCSMAGASAEAILTGRHNFQCASSDFKHISNLLINTIVDPQELALYARWLWLRTRNTLLMRINRIRTTALAEALLEQKKLSSRSARKIMDEAVLKTAQVRPEVLRALHQAQQRVE